MNRRYFLATMAAVAMVGCTQPASFKPSAADDDPPPAGARLVVLKLPGMV